MGKKQYWNTDAKSKRWIKEGRGQGSGSGSGSGSDYKPWLTIRDVPSQVDHTESSATLLNAPVISSPTLNLPLSYSFNDDQ